MDLVELLNTRGIEYKKTNNPTEILVSCTSGEHTDKSPSLSYNLEKNVFQCMVKIQWIKNISCFLPHF